MTTLAIPVRSTDLDADQVVNNAVYFNYFEQVRLSHLRRLGVIARSRAISEIARSFAIAATEARFLAPSRFPETLQLDTWTKEVRTRSFILSYRAVRQSDGVVVAEGSSVQVWLDAVGKSTPLPEPVRQALLTSLHPSGED